MRDKFLGINEFAAHMTDNNADNLLERRWEQLTERRQQRLTDAARQRQRGLMVVMEDVHNPHNLAAIARSCDAFGVQQVTFTVQDHNLFDPHSVGRISSSSASKWLDYRIFETGTKACFQTLQAEGWHLLATVAGDDIPSLYDVDLTAHEKLAVLVGNEHQGLSQTAINLADSYITIPMRGMIQSFNVSVATAITLAEITRQREASPVDFNISPEDARTLALDFMQRRQFER